MNSGAFPKNGCSGYTAFKETRLKPVGNQFGLAIYEST